MYSLAYHYHYVQVMVSLSTITLVTMVAMQAVVSKALGMFISIDWRIKVVNSSSSSSTDGEIMSVLKSDYNFYSKSGMSYTQVYEPAL